MTMTITGKLSGRPIHIPDVNAPPMPSLASPGVILNGRAATGFGTIGEHRGYPDARSFRRKFGLVLPATNTSLEPELWGIIYRNQGLHALRGVGLHTVNVVTPRPVLATEADLRSYKAQFLDGLQAAVRTALLAQPEYMIMGMSLEHILSGLDQVRAPMADVISESRLGWATWHEAAAAALSRYGARRIGLLTPFDRTGNDSAARLFQDLGYEVVASVGFSCANALHIAHIPDWAKERAILECLATPDHRLDAIVQCGTNMSLVDVAERVEPIVGIPVLGINATTFWYALRENGFDSPLQQAGRLLREF